MGADCQRPASFGWSAIQEGGKLCVLRLSLMRRVARGVALSEAELVRHAAHGPEHRLERLTFFSDAVFAIAITILVVDIHVPTIPDNATNLDWLKALLALAPELWSFGLSFIVIGSLWARHHATLSMLGKYDERLMWPNLFLLMSIAFLPFSTALLADGHGRLSPVPFAVYDVSLLIAGLLKTRLTYVALSGNLVLPHVTTVQIKAERRGSWILPIAATLALGLAFYWPAWNNLGLLSIVALRSLPYFAAPRVAKAAVGEMAEPRSGTG
jgi:uncharacterized membrane protein